MTDGLPDGPEHVSETLVELEVLAPEFEGKPERGITLRDDAARDAANTLAKLARRGTGVARRGTAATYRLAAPDKAAQGLADGSLRWATAKDGDASVLIKEASTGRIQSHGSLHKVKPNPAKVLGPAVWEAMAMATQQHYLVEINNKLEGIEHGVKQGLSRDDDDKLGTLQQASRTARESAYALSEGRTLSPNRIQDVRDAAQRADVAWHQLHHRATRNIAEYKRGDASAAEVEQSWALLLKATQTLGECSAVLAALPYATVQELEDATAEERERALAAIHEVRELAQELQLAHGQWAAAKADWELRYTRNPVKKAVRIVRKTAALKPQQGPLDYATAWRASQLGVPPAAPEALLVTVNDDGTVDVASEPARDTPLV